MRLFFVVLALGIAACILPPRGPAIGLDENATVALMQDLGMGFGPVCGGVWVAKDWILTANHCVVGSADDPLEDLDEIDYITDPNSQVRRTARTVFRDETHDLALLQAITWPKHWFAHVAPSQPEQGQNLHVIGHPRGLLWSYMHGTLIAYRTSLPGSTRGAVLQVQVPIQPGNSGGPAFDDEGWIVGIADSINDGLPGEGFFVPYDTIHSFLRASGLEM